jgi:hypothetical protein
MLCSHWSVSFQFSPDEFCKIAGNQQTIFSFLSRPNLQFCRSLFSPVQPQTDVVQNTAVRALHRSDCSRLCLYLPRQYNSKAALKKHKISNHRSKIAIQPPSITLRGGFDTLERAFFGRFLNDWRGYTGDTLDGQGVHVV